MKKYEIEARYTKDGADYDHSSELFDLIGDYTEADCAEDAKYMAIEYYCDLCNQNTDPALAGCETYYDKERDEIITKELNGNIVELYYDIKVKKHAD